MHRNLLTLSYDRFSDLTGTDYSEGAIDLAKKIATRDGFTNINFLVRINLAIMYYNNLRSMLNELHRLHLKF